MPPIGKPQIPPKVPVAQPAGRPSPVLPTPGKPISATSPAATHLPGSTGNAGVGTGITHPDSFDSFVIGARSGMAGAVVVSSGNSAGILVGGPPSAKPEVAKKPRTREEILTADQELRISILASALHAKWRDTYRTGTTTLPDGSTVSNILPDGQMRPRIKKTSDEAWIRAHEAPRVAVDGTPLTSNQVDIANSNFQDLPADWKDENYKAAAVAVSVLGEAGGNDRMLSREFVDEVASSIVHQKWLDRNGTWANEIQKSPYKDLPESEKKKDQDQVLQALEDLFRVRLRETEDIMREMGRTGRLAREEDYYYSVLGHIRSLRDIFERGTATAKPPKPPAADPNLHGLAEDIVEDIAASIAGNGAVSPEIRMAAARTAVREVTERIFSGQEIDDIAIEEMSAAVYASVFPKGAASYDGLPNVEKIKYRDIVTQAYDVIRIRSAEIAARLVTDPEFRTEMTATSYLEVLLKEYHHVFELLKKAKTLEMTTKRGYLDKIEIIKQRILFWAGELRRTAVYGGQARSDFEADVKAGERILLDRILELEMTISSYVAERERELEGLRMPRRLPPKEPKGEPLPSPYPIIPALANHDVGLGEDLMLRPHQEGPFRRICGLFKDLAERQSTGGALPEVLLQGNIVLPTGGGKTRLMVASLAAAIETGLYRDGDKFIIMSHRDQIHGQNTEVMDLLRAYFKKKTGRGLRVSEYKAGSTNVSGDVVMVSIPSVSTEEQRAEFQKKMWTVLGGDRKIAMVGVDEIHHLGLGVKKGLESWKLAIRMLRELSPNFYRLGFTATPSEDIGVTIAKVKNADLMRDGVAPHTYLVRVLGIDLSQLRISKDSEDFQTRQLVSTLIGRPERNTRLYEALEKYGLQKEEKNPRGKSRLEGVLAFGADLEHATMMADDYARYFAEPGENLRGRKLAVLGRGDGKIDPKELSRVLDAYRRGESDGVIVLVSGDTEENIRGDILNGVKAGEIEAVFNVGVWSEGADLYMFTHLLGGRPTLSQFLKGQEGGRLNRRAGVDVGPNGELLRDLPKILFDVVDDYHRTGRQLVEYGAVVGASGYASVPRGELFDVKSEKIADSKPSQTDEEKPERKKKPRPPAAIPGSVLGELHRVLEQNYGGDVGAIAQDLGIPSDEMAGILNGEGWINQRWFLRRMSTLLYQDRHSLERPYNAKRRAGSEGVKPLDYEILLGALAVYEAREGIFAYGNVVIEGDAGLGQMSVEISGEALSDLRLGVAAEKQWRTVWRGLALYFGVQARKSRDPEAALISGNLIRHFFDREGWEDPAREAEKSVLREVRERIALRYGRLPPELRLNPRVRSWIAGSNKGFDQTGADRDFFRGVNSLLINLGVLPECAKEMCDRMIFEMTLERWLAHTETGSHPGGVYGKIFAGMMPVREFLRKLREKYDVSRTSPSEARERVLSEVFMRNGWARQVAPSSDREKVLLAARELVAVEFGWQLPRDHGIEGLPRASCDTLNSWLATGSSGASENKLYGQVGMLLSGLGMSREQSEELSENARTEAKLEKWIAGQEVNRDNGQEARDFFAKVLKRFVREGLTETQAKQKLTDMAFKRNGWSIQDTSVLDNLLSYARQAVAPVFGGPLPRHHGVSGIPPQVPDALNKWLTYGKIWDYDDVRLNRLFQHIRALIVNLGGMEPEIIDVYIDTAKTVVRMRRVPK